MKFVARSIIMVAGLFCATLTTTVVAQQTYPSRVVRVVLGWPAGGGADITARLLAPRLGERLGQQFIVENRAGATGAIGAEYVARANPDGYTLLFGDVSSLVINPQIEKVNYDLTRDFAVVSPLSIGPYVLVIHPSLQARSVRELVALAKSRPGKLDYASGGGGTNLQLVAEQFNLSAGINVKHIPYKGGGPAGMSVLAGETQMMYSTIASVISNVQAKKFIALAVTSAERSPLMPGVPTFAEAGFPTMDAGAWFVLLAPAGTPSDVINKLNAEITRISGTADYRSQLEKLGYAPFISSPDKFSQFAKSELDRWGKTIKATGTKGN